ncbi:MAG: arsenate reductase family protein [Nitrospirae bacterium]|nr:arsenate reductase family protein [Nitrospirota bacterium]
MSHITIFQKPTCSTCRKVIKLVEESGQPYTAINYYEEPLTTSKLKSLLKKGGLKAREVMRSKEDIYKTLGLAKADQTENELIDLMIQHPDLLQRPLVEKGDKVILARPPETIHDIL